jgi:DNA (cytosine-5)-methyltransferase 1
MQKSQPIAIDLFCGAGGLSLGFEQAGFNVAVGIDLAEMNTRVHAKNFPKCITITADISKISGTDIRSQSRLSGTSIDVVIGGPPCQGFSTIGKRDAKDPRNKLVFEFGRIVEEIRPSYWVMENVGGLMVGKAREVLTSFVNRMKEAGYRVVEPLQVLNAENYGVPQKRRRIFIIGYEIDVCAPTYPTSIRDQRGCQEIYRPTVWDAIADLHSIDHSSKFPKEDTYTGRLKGGSSYARILRGELLDPSDFSERNGKKCSVLTGCHVPLHEKRVIRRFNETLPGDYELISKFYRLTREGLSNTLRAGTERSRGGFTAARPIHPIKPRCITVREAARLHSFPDWFCFDSTTWGGFRQVGNSVPPLLGRAVGVSIKKAIIQTLNN